MSEYTYDEEGFNFFYFLLSVLSLCLVPVTGHSIYSLWQSTRMYSIIVDLPTLGFAS